MLNSPFFITGFESSGTTLLRRIMSMHPSLDKDIIHEQRKLLEYRSAKHAEMNYFDEYSSILSGEKVPYYTNVTYIKNYIEKFIEYWPQGSVYHITREPESCAKSSKRRFNRDYDAALQFCKSGVENMHDYLVDLSYECFEINYDELVKYPDVVIKNIYESMGEGVEVEYIEKVISTKEPWNYKGKRCCGLRYASFVGKVEHE